MKDSITSTAEHYSKKRVGYFVPNWFGDCLMAWPAIYSKIIAEPDVQHCIITKNKLFSLWQFLLKDPSVEILGCVEILGYDDAAMSMFHLIKKMRALSIERLHLFTETPRNFIVGYLSGAAVRVGFRRGISSFFLTHTIDKKSTEHRAKNYFVLVNPDKEYNKNFFAPIDTSASLPEHLEIALLSNCAALFPGAARGPSKRWPYFAQLAKSLEMKNVTPFILGSSADKEVADSISSGINACGQLNIAQLASLVSKVKFAVTNDSGGMHLVDNIGTPLVAIFGLTDPGVTGPRNIKSQVVKAEGRSNVSIEASDDAAIKALASISLEVIEKKLLD